MSCRVLPGMSGGEAFKDWRGLVHFWRFCPGAVQLKRKMSSDSARDCKRPPLVEFFGQGSLRFTFGYVFSHAFSSLSLTRILMNGKTRVSIPETKRGSSPRKTSRLSSDLVPTFVTAASQRRPEEPNRRGMGWGWVFSMVNL